MKRKNIALIPFLALLLTLVCCSKDNDGFWGSSNANLQVSAFYAPAAAYQTRSVADSTQTDAVAPADTLYIDDQTCMTTLVTDLVSDRPLGAAAEPIDTTLETRGTPIDSPNLLTSLNLVMFNTQAANYAEATSTATDLFTITANSGDFILDKTYAWTAGSTDKHTFIAIAPKTGANGIAIAADRKSLTYTVPTTTTDHPDLCLSDISRNQNVVNSVGSNNHNQRFAMKHCLTAIGFEAMGYDLRITKVTLKGASTTAVLNLTAGTWGSFASAADRQPGINTGTWLMCNDNTQPVNITNANGYLMMIPQTLTDAHTLIIEYEGRSQQSGTGSYTVKLKDVGVAWTAGKKIVYQLRLKTKPAVENSALAIADPRGRYTTPLPLTISAATDDNLTFSWSESWLRIHRGNPGYIASGGAPSGWSTGVNNWKNLYFFAAADNPSTAAARTATVTVTGKKSGKRTFTVTQEKMVALGMSPIVPGEVIPTTGKTYTVGITSNTTWRGTEQTGATLSPASGNGNNSAVRIVVPKNVSWKEVPVKVSVSTTNTVGPVLTRTWTGTQPGLPFTSTTTAINIDSHLAGYVANYAPVFDAAADDELTFIWSESWLKLYSGNRANTVNPSIGSGSGFKATAAQWNKLWFFTTNDNPEAIARVATVTVRSKSGTTKTFTVSQKAIPFDVTNNRRVLDQSYCIQVVSGIQAAPNDLLTISSNKNELIFYLINSPQNGAWADSATSLANEAKIRGSELSKLCIVLHKNSSFVGGVTTITNSQGISKHIYWNNANMWAAKTDLSEIYFGANPSSTTYSFTERRSIAYIDEDSRLAYGDINSISVTSKFVNSNLNSNLWLDRNWVTAQYVGARRSGSRVYLDFNVTYKRNIYPQRRTAQLNLEITYKRGSQIVTIPITQESSDHYYIFDGFDGDGKPTNHQPRLAIASQNIGSFFFGENWRCVNAFGQGWTTPVMDQLSLVNTMVRNRYLARKIFDFDINGFWTYNTASDGAFWIKQGYYFTEHQQNNSLNFYVGIRRGNRAYRCVKSLY